MVEPYPREAATTDLLSLLLIRIARKTVCPLWPVQNHPYKSCSKRCNFDYVTTQRQNILITSDGARAHSAEPGALFVQTRETWSKAVMKALDVWRHLTTKR